MFVHEFNGEEKKTSTAQRVQRRNISLTVFFSMGNESFDDVFYCIFS